MCSVRVGGCTTHVYRALGRRREVAVVTLPTYSEKVLQQPFDELFVPLNSKINAIGRTYTYATPRQHKIK